MHSPTSGIPLAALQAPQVPQPPPPVSPTPTPPPIGVIPNTGSEPGRIVIQVPLTAREIAAIRARRSELSNQLTSAEGRRERLVGELEDATGASRAGLEQRIKLLDERILQLESDIAETGKQLTSAPAGPAIGEVAARPDFTGAANKAAMVGSLVTVFVFFPIALAVARLIWRRGRAPTLPPGWAEAAQRLERLEQAMDTIAIEMERVSEGQRFTTKILTQRAAENGAAPADPGVKAIGAGPAEPVPLNNAAEQKQGVRVPRN